MSNRLFVLISGFGEPHWDEKVRILRSNLLKIREGPWEHLHIEVCVYTPNRSLPPDITEKVTLRNGPGIVGQFWMRHASPATLKDQYDYFLFLLDDVELQPDVDWSEMIALKNDLRLDILQPSMTEDSQYTYQYTRQQPQAQFSVAVTRLLEYFCFFMDFQALEKYFKLMTEDNPWMWGIDLVLVKHGKLRVGVTNHMTMKHHYKGESYAYVKGADPAGDFTRYLTKFNETPQSIFKNVRPYQYLVVKV